MLRLGVLATRLRRSRGEI
uniref:Uncharacterized protein n=1 Tax=Arundo donax TaxID=35708 RepID=A0A0A9HFX9_ARUDO